MAKVEMRRMSNGKWQSYFYVRVYAHGVTRVQSTGVKWAGTPPDTPTNSGDATFEESRALAEKAADEIREKATAEGRDTMLESKLLERITGESRWNDLAISRLPETLASIKHRREKSARWIAWKASVVEEFVAWARHTRKIKTVLGVTYEVASEYMDHLLTPDEDGKARTTKTVRSIKLILKSLFDKILPADRANPFKQVKIETPRGDREIHRIPLTPTEIEQLLRASEDDPLIHDLIVTALSTGLRRGDCCKLKWESVDLRGNALRIETHKTDAEVYLPIMPALRQVIEARLADRKETDKYVFPDAAWRHDNTPSYLTDRMKRAFARALAGPDEIDISGAAPQNRVELRDVLPKVLEAVVSAKMTAKKRTKMEGLLKAYASGQSFRDIEKAQDVSRGGISNLLHEAEGLSGVRFLPDLPRKGEGLKKVIKNTLRKERTIGMRSASLYDFHALRTTFVTQAILGGMSIDKLKALTGHTTVDIVLRHYFKPRGTDVAKELEAALPASLTGGASAKRAEARPRALPEASDQRQLAEIAEHLGKMNSAERDELLSHLRKSDGSCSESATPIAAQKRRGSLR